VYLFTGLDYWTGLLDWTTGLDYWTGLLDWTTGLDYWTDIFLVFTHVVVGLIDSCWLQAFREHAAHHLNGKYI